jgi:hypothetical protein
MSTIDETLELGLSVLVGSVLKQHVGLRCGQVMVTGQEVDDALPRTVERPYWCSWT